MKAYLINSLKIGKKTHRASTDESPVIVDLDSAEFKRLAAMAAVRAPTENELKIAGLDIDGDEPQPKKLTKAEQKKADEAEAAAADAAAAEAAAGDNLPI